MIMEVTLFFIAGTVLGSVITHYAFRSGSNQAHQAYEVIYTTPEEPKKDQEEDETKLTSQMYDWDEYDSSTRFQQFEEDDNLNEEPN